MTETGRMMACRKTKSVYFWEPYESHKLTLRSHRGEILNITLHVVLTSTVRKVCDQNL